MMTLWTSRRMCSATWLTYSAMQIWIGGCALSVDPSLELVPLVATRTIPKDEGADNLPMVVIAQTVSLRSFIRGIVPSTKAAHGALSLRAFFTTQTQTDSLGNLCGLILPMPGGIILNMKKLSVFLSLALL